MNRKKTIAGAVAGLLVFVAAFAVEARPFGFGRQDTGMGPGWGRLQFFLELKLSEVQQAEMMNIIKKYQSERENLRTNSIALRNNLRTAWQSDPFNEEAARQAFRRASALREERFVLSAKMMGELKAMLTTEQRELLKEKKAQ